MVNDAGVVSDCLLTYLEGFAFSGATFDEVFAEELVVTHARQTVLRVLARHPDAFEELGPDIVETVRPAVSGPLTFDDVWSRPMAAAWATFRGDSSYPAGRTARALRDWAASKLLLSPITTPESLPAFRGNHRFLIRYKEMLDADDPFREEAISVEEHASVVAAFDRAFDIIDAFAPEYGPWTLRLLRDIIPLDSAPGSMRSGSSVAEPGSCHISFRVGPVQLAEMLVHETTHQYYYLLSRYGPVDDGGDQQLYYSPAKECGRPIHYILIAYHAFANVLLFSRRCLAGTNEDKDGYLRHNVNVLSGWMQSFERALQRTRALTDVGRALWLPLARELRRHDLVADTTVTSEKDLAAQVG